MTVIVAIFVVIMIVLLVMMVTVVFAIPMAFVYLPALLIVVVVGMAPVGAGIGRALPDAGSPDVAASIVAPVAFSPYIAFAGHCRTDFNAQGRWGAADVDVDLRNGRSGDGGKSQAADKQV